jgi:tetratricopeptide (TPR) repeat protein
VTDADQPLDDTVHQATRLLLMVTDALVLGGWLESPAFDTLARRARDQSVTLVVVRVGAAPLEQLPDDLPVFRATRIDAAIAHLERGTPSPPRPHTADVVGDPAAWARYAARVREGASPDSARLATGRPPGLVPGGFLTADLRLLQLRTTDAAVTRWLAEDADGHPAEIALAGAIGPRRTTSLEEVSRAWAALRHPRIQTVHSSGRREGAAWIAWRSATTTLDQALADGMGQEHLLLAVLDVADALEHAHAAGCIHGCPAPIWVGMEHDGVRLAGFGWSSLGRATTEQLLFTAPELMEPTRPGTVAGDVYGFGMLVLMALFGDALPYWVLRDPNRLLRQLDPDPALAAALRDALEWNPATRASTTRPLVDALLADAERVERLARRALADDLLDQAERLLDRLDRSDVARASQSLRLSLARKRASTGAPDDAIRSLLVLAERTDDAAAVWLEIAVLYRERGRPDDAVQAARKAWDTHRDRTTAQQVLRLLVALDTGDLEAWTERLLGFVDAPERAALVRRVAQHRQDHGDPTGALAWLERLDEPSLDADRRMLRAALGDPTARILDWLEAGEPGALQLALDLAAPLGHPLLQEVALAILDHDPDHVEARRQVARRVSGTDLPATLEATAALSAIPGATAADHAFRARTLLSAGQGAEALAAAERALDLEPHHTTALGLAERAAALVERWDRAAEHLSTRLALADTTDAEGSADRLRLGELLERAGRVPEARRVYREVLARDPDHARATWALVRLAPEADPIDLAFGPHEALASLLTPMLAGDEDSAWPRAVAAVDRLLAERALHAGLFESLFAHCPHWAEPIGQVLAAWRGEDGAATPSDALAWRGTPSHRARPLRHVLRPSDRLPGPAEPAPHTLPLREVLADPPRTTTPDELLPLQLRVGDGAAAVPVALTDSRVLSPTTIPLLPGMLTVFRSRDAVYLAVDEGQLRRQGDLATEFRVRAGDRLSWRGVPLRVLDPQTPSPSPPKPQSTQEPQAAQEPQAEPVAPPELPPVDDLEDITEPRVATPRFLSPVLLRRLPRDQPAIVWEAHGLLRALPLPVGDVAVVLRPDDGPGFTSAPIDDAIGRFRRDGDRVVWRAAGAERALQTGDVLTVDDHRITFHARGETASPSESPTVEMTRPTPPTRCWLVLDDGGPDGRRVAVTTSPFRLGRVRDCELPLRDDPLLSRVHAQLERVDDSWYAVDCGSANGTRVNGLGATGRVRLSEGDRIELGRTLLVFTLNGPTASDDLPERPMETDEQVELLDPDPDDEEDTRSLSAAEIDDARRRSAATAITPEEGARMVEIANAALSVLLRALDDTEGPGAGRGELQRLVDQRARPTLVRGLSVRDPVLPVEAVASRLRARDGTERRGDLARALLDLLDAARDAVGPRLSPSRAAEVDALLDALEVERRLGS